MNKEERAGQTLIQGSAFLTAGRIWTLITGYALNLYLARELGPDFFGMYGVIISLLGWIELVVAEGMPRWITRTTAQTPGSPVVPRVYIVVQLLLSLALMVAMLIAAPGLAYLFGDSGHTDLFMVAAIDIPIFAFYHIFLALILGKQIYSLHMGTQVTYSTTKLLSTILLVGIGFSLTGAVIGSILASIAGLAATTLMLLVHFRGHLLIQKVKVQHQLREAAAGSGAPAILLILQILAVSIDLWIVRAVLPGEEAGFYRAASIIAQIPILLSAGFSWALYSSFSEAYGAGDLERCRHYLRQSTRVLLMGGGLWAALVITSPEPLLSLLFSAAYSAGAPVLIALSIGFVLGNIAVATSLTLLVQRSYGAVLGVAAALVAAEIVAVLALIGPLGALGAAIAAGSAMGLAGLATLSYVRKFLPRELPTLVIRVGISAGLVGVTASLLGLTTPLDLALGYPALSLAYVVLLYATGGITRADVAAIRTGFAKKQTPRDLPPGTAQEYPD